MEASAATIIEHARKVFIDASFCTTLDEARAFADQERKRLVEEFEKRIVVSMPLTLLTSVVEAPEGDSPKRGRLKIDAEADPPTETYGIQLTGVKPEKIACACKALMEGEATYDVSSRHKLDLSAVKHIREQLVNKKLIVEGAA